MRDGWSESFDLCSPYSYEALRWQRYGREPPLISGKVLLIAVSSLVLLGFVSADVALYNSQPVTVHVTAVEWFVPGSFITAVEGFTMHGSEPTTVTLTCTGLCLRFDGATVEAPFTVEGFSVAYQPVETVNVTVQSPATAYTGPIAVILNIG